MRIATFHALVFLVGGSLGWWVAGLNSNDAEIVISLRSDSSTATVEQAYEMEGQQIATMPASSYSSKDVPANENISEIVNARQWTSNELIDYLVNLDNQQFWQAQNAQEFESLKIADEAFIIELLEQYLAQPSGVREKLRILILNADIRRSDINETNDGFSIEDWVFDNIKQEHRTEEWLEFVASIGVRKTQNLKYVQDRLRTSNNERNTALMLRAISHSYIGVMDRISEQEKRELVGQLKPYFASENAEVRAAVIETLLNHEQANSHKLVLAALKDEDDLVVQSAMNISISKRYFSKEFEQAIMAKMLNPESSDEVKAQAYSLLSRVFPLDEQKYETVFEFGTKEIPEIQNRIRSKNNSAQ